LPLEISGEAKSRYPALQAIPKSPSTCFDVESNNSKGAKLKRIEGTL
jgi:hypothetical protein